MHVHCICWRWCKKVAPQEISAMPIMLAMSMKPLHMALFGLMGSTRPTLGNKAAP